LADLLFRYGQEGMAQIERRHDNRLDAVYLYWRHLADRAALSAPDKAARLPSRSMVDPTALPRCLPWMIMLDATASDWRYRLVGTAIDHLHGRPLTGMTISESWPRPIAETLIEGLVPCLRDGLPALLRLSFSHRDAGEPYRIHSLFLPLASDGKRVDRLIGVFDEGAIAGVSLPRCQPGKALVPGRMVGIDTIAGGMRFSS
jgi:hypothetical protein